MTYTMRPSGLGDASDRGEDFVFRYNGHDVGRCYLRGMTGSTQVWWWTIYLGGGQGRASRPVEGARRANGALTLEAAQAEFKEAFDKMIAAGVVR